MSWPDPGHDTTPPVVQYNTPPALIAFTLAILVLCFVAFSIVYLCKYCLVSAIQSLAFERSASGSLVRLSPNRRSPSRGLDPSLLHVFPTFVYSSVKNLRKKNKFSLECAICLLELDDDSVLRLLPVCCHVFHQECIDLWLRSHKTCPVCRTDLDSPSTETPKYGDNCNHIMNRACAEGDLCTCESGGDISIDIREREGGDGDGGGQSAHDHHDHDHDQAVGVKVQQQQEHTRSHSTGHSIVMIREEEGADDEDQQEYDNKYTLRLPEHVIGGGGGHNCSKSCTSYQEMQITRPACSNCGFVESISAAACSNSLAHAQKNLTLHY